jgi:5S rRNA maturation endonuclease (ribonuclease M5)
MLSIFNSSLLFCNFYIHFQKKFCFDIIYKIKPYTKADIEYWNKYGITKEELMIDGILSILWYKFYSNRMKREVIIRPKGLSFIYTEFFPKVKIYSPYEKKTNGKWIANVTQNNIGNIKNLPIHAKKLIITKSYKDCRVLQNHGVLSIWFQNEGMLPDDKYLYNLGKRFDEIIVLFDNDRAGIIASKKITQEINSRLPNKARYVIISSFKGVTDPSDLYKYNRFELINFINKSNLL